MSQINQALAFLKPHVAEKAQVLTYVEQAFAATGIAIIERRKWKSADLVAANVADRHYCAHSKAGTAPDVAKLSVGEDVRRAFAAAFSSSWDDALAAGRILSGLTAQTRLGITTDELSARWLRYGARKLTGGMYASNFAQEGMFVLNGFYPSIRADFADPAAQVLALLVEFDPARLSWQRFRDAIIGVTNPAAAQADSIRGFLHAHQAEFGIQVTYRQNVIHASASAFEALCEKTIWLPERPTSRDPLWKAVEGHGVTFSRICSLREENPIVTLDNRTGPLVDLLENLDTDPTAERLLRVAGGC